MSDDASTPDKEKGSRHENKRTPAQKADDALFIQRLHLRGQGVREIAEALSKVRPYTLSHQQVALDLKKLRQMWLKEAVGHVAIEKQKELRKLDMLEAELWTEWDKSKIQQTKTLLRRKTKGGAKGAGDDGKTPADEEKSAVTTSAVGDPAIARAILEVCRDRRKILGIDAATKLEHSGPDGGPIVQANVSVTDEDADALLERHFQRWAEDRATPPATDGSDADTSPAQDPA